MCRLLGVVTRHDRSLTTTLGATLTSFRSMSQVHCDGWGLAYWDRDGELIHAKKPESALHSIDFDTAVTSAITDAALLHIRKASPAMANTCANTHPFVSGSVAFAHNGWLYPQPPLEQLAKSSHAPESSGDTDSELFFSLVLAQLRHLEPIDAIQAAITQIDESEVAYLSLNCLLLTDDSLYAVECWDPAAVASKGDPPDTFALRFRAHDDVATVASSGWEESVDEWNELGNGQVLQIHRGDLRTTVHRMLLQRD